MGPTLLLDRYPVNEITDFGETDHTDLIEPDEPQSFDLESNGLSVPDRDVTGVATDVEADAAPTMRQRLRRGLGRVAAVLAMTGTAIAGIASLAPDEAEAGTRHQGAVACRNNDGTTGVRLGELCLVNTQRYSSAKGPSNTDKAIALVMGGALGGKCETAFYAGEAAASVYTGYAIKVYKGGKFLKNATVAGLVLGAAGDAISNRVC